MLNGQIKLVALPCLLRRISNRANLCKGEDLRVKTHLQDKIIITLLTTGNYLQSLQNRPSI